MKSRRLPLSLFSRLTIVTGAVFIFSILTTELYFARHERTSLEMDMREKATFINNFYAFLISDALQHNDDVTLLQVVNRLEQDPEITSVLVVDAKGLIRYDADPEKVGATMDDPLLKKALDNGEGIASDFENSGGRAMALVSPLKLRGQSTPMGATRIEFTYKHLRDRVHSGMASFGMMAIGCLSICVGGVLWGVRKCVLNPLSRLKASVSRINPAAPEADLPESEDDFGQLAKTLNEVILRLRADWQAQRALDLARSANDKQFAEQLLRSFMPGARVLIADKDNRILSDIQDGSEHMPAGLPHLLDWVTDENFAALVAGAFQKEGKAATGPVTFQDKTYQATVLRLPEGQSRLVRTVIALRPSVDTTPQHP